MGLVPGVDSSSNFESMDCSSRVAPGAVTVTVSSVESFCAGLADCGAAELLDEPCAGAAELEAVSCCCGTAGLCCAGALSAESSASATSIEERAADEGAGWFTGFS